MSQLNAYLTMNHIGASFTFPDTLAFRKTYRARGTPAMVYRAHDKSPKCKFKSGAVLEQPRQLPRKAGNGGNALVMSWNHKGVTE